MAMRRINVIGTSCAGKTTFAAELAARLGVVHVELDALHWEPGWVEISDGIFRQRVAVAIEREDGWVVDGNYSIARDILWSRVDTIVWLDYGLPLVLWRAITRTLRRAIDREPCCNGNRESFWRAFSRDSILWWVISTHQRRRREFHQSLPAMIERGCSVVVLRSPREANLWLAGRAAQAGASTSVDTSSR
jgi:adenylate kinase family enzyme